jgi:hypothetical protein
MRPFPEFQQIIQLLMDPALASVTDPSIGVEVTDVARLKIHQNATPSVADCGRSKSGIGSKISGVEQSWLGKTLVSGSASLMCQRDRMTIVGSTCPMLWKMVLPFIRIFNSSAKLSGFGSSLLRNPST